ncbi:hypothetical protein ACP275_14G253600 [Erythranthe tilingii]
MDHDHMPGMATPPPPPSAAAGGMEHHSSMGMTHMTFFWGKNSEILFSGWPGTRTGMYVLALLFVFVLAVIVEWLAHCQWIKKRCGGEFSGGLMRTVVHGTRIGLAYIVMLAIMSFNGGVFIVAVAGHIFGFFLFGSRLCFNKYSDSHKDFPPPPAC